MFFSTDRQVTADASGTLGLNIQSVVNISWVDSLTRMDGRGGISDFWSIWSFPVWKVQHHTNVKVVSEWFSDLRENFLSRDSPCSTNVSTSSWRQVSGTQIATKYWTLSYKEILCLGSEFIMYGFLLSQNVVLFPSPAWGTLGSIVQRRW